MGLTTCAFGQALLLGNFGNTGGFPSQTGGRVYELIGGGAVLFNGDYYDLGVAVSFGTSQSNLTPYETYYPGHNDGNPYTGMDYGAFYLGAMGVSVSPPGAVPGGSIWVELQIWDYNTPGLGGSQGYDSYDAALNGGDDVGTVIFLQTRLSDRSAAPPTVPTLLTQMPSVVLGPVPEPSNLALAGLGVASLLAFRRRKQADKMTPQSNQPCLTAIKRD